MSIGLDPLEPYEFPPEVNQPQPKPHSFYDFLKDILLPAIPAIGMVLSWKSPLRLAFFGAVAIVFGALGLYPRIIHWRHVRRERASDTEAAREGLEELRQLARRFGDFVNTGFGGSLHNLITSEMSPTIREEVAHSIDIPTLAMWQSFWSFLKTGINRVPPTLDNLKFEVQELHNLIVGFGNLFVAPLFDRMEPGLRQRLTDSDRGKLNGFQQRYAAFGADYEQFARTLAESQPDWRDLPQFLPHYNPL